MCLLFNYVGDVGEGISVCTLQYHNMYNIIYLDNTIYLARMGMCHLSLAVSNNERVELFEVN